MNRQEILNSAMALAGALKRTMPGPGEHAFPPAVERCLDAIYENEPLSSRELCDILDIRPSSASEMAARMEAAGLILRQPDGDDKRVTKLSLTDGTRALMKDSANAREERLSKLTACFSDQEAEQFCLLADKLSSHIKSLGGDEGCCRGKGGRGPEGCPGGPEGPRGCHGKPHGPEGPRGCHRHPEGPEEFRGHCGPGGPEGFRRPPMEFCHRGPVSPEGFPMPPEEFCPSGQGRRENLPEPAPYL